MGEKDSDTQGVTALPEHIHLQHKSRRTVISPPGDLIARALKLQITFIGMCQLLRVREDAGFCPCESSTAIAMCHCVPGDVGQRGAGLELLHIVMANGRLKPTDAYTRPNEFQEV